MEAKVKQGAPEAMAVQGAQEDMAVQGAQEDMAGVIRGRVPATTAGTFVPPKKKSMGQLGGIRSPPGINKQDRTAHRNRKPSWARLRS